MGNTTEYGYTEEVQTRKTPEMAGVATPMSTVMEAEPDPVCTITVPVPGTEPQSIVITGVLPETTIGVVPVEVTVHT